MRINMRAVFYLTSLAVPYLTETQGCIVNVSSVNGMRSVSFQINNIRSSVLTTPKCKVANGEFLTIS